MSNSGARSATGNGQRRHGALEAVRRNGVNLGPAHGRSEDSLALLSSVLSFSSFSLPRYLLLC